MNKDIENMKRLWPCNSGLRWFETQPDFETAWETCERGDWMLWYAKKIGVDLRPLTLAKGRCAELVKHLMDDERSRKAVEVAIAFGQGNATREELDDAASAAHAAAHATYAAHYSTLAQCANICREVLTKEIIK